MLVDYILFGCCSICISVVKLSKHQPMLMISYCLKVGSFGIKLVFSDPLHNKFNIEIILTKVTFKHIRYWYDLTSFYQSFTFMVGVQSYTELHENYTIMFE